MQITVKLFGPQARVVGRRAVTVEAGPQPPTVAAVARMLGEQFPELGSSLPRCRLAVNHAFAGPEQSIHEGDEVALIGQVSGG